MNCTIKRSEAEIQNAIRHLLATLGYTVLEVGKARRKVQCTRCKAWSYPTGWQGNTIGTPDLYVHAPWWTVPVGIGFELKKPGGAVRKEQRNLANLQMTDIVHSEEEALEVVIKVERTIGSEEKAKRLEVVLENVR
jgi:hypothetical protein